MCFGGGGGDDGSKEIRRDEARREYDMAAAAREINKLFGIYDPDVIKIGEDLPTKEEWLATVPQFKRRFIDKPELLDRRYGSFINNLYTAQDAGDVYGAKSFGYGYALPADINANQTAYENYLAREAAYDKNRSDIMKYFTQGLDEQLMDTTQKQTYDLARRGLLQGSEDLQAEAGRTRRYDDALFKLTNEADSSVNNLRGADEQTRLNLLGNIRAGMDRESAVAGATAGLTNNLNTAANAAYATQFTGLFDDLNNIYKNYNYNTGQSRGMVMPYGGGGYSPGTKV